MAHVMVDAAVRRLVSALGAHGLSLDALFVARFMAPYEALAMRVFRDAADGDDEALAAACRALAGELALSPSMKGG